MSYKIPKNLTKYSESFLFGLSFKSFVYVLLCAFFVLYIMNNAIAVPPKYPMWVGITLSAIVVILLVVFFFFDIEMQLANASKLMNSSRNMGYFDYRIKYFMGIKTIKNNTVYLRNNKILGVIEVKPIEFSVMDKNSQDFVLKMYEKWLKNLTYPVQIVSRSTELNMTKWVTNIKESASDKQRADSLSRFLEHEAAKHSVRNRVFYCIIPYDVLKKKITKFDGLKKMFGLKTDESFNDSDFEDFNNRMLDSIKFLRNINLEARRLKTDELIGLYSSYFTDMTSSSESYITEYTTTIDVVKESLEKESKESVMGVKE